MRVCASYFAADEETKETKARSLMPIANAHPLAVKKTVLNTAALLLAALYGVRTAFANDEAEICSRNCGANT